MIKVFQQGSPFLANRNTIAISEDSTNKNPIVPSHSLDKTTYNTYETVLYIQNDDPTKFYDYLTICALKKVGATTGYDTLTVGGSTITTTTNNILAEQTTKTIPCEHIVTSEYSRDISPITIIDQIPNTHRILQDDSIVSIKLAYTNNELSPASWNDKTSCLVLSSLGNPNIPETSYIPIRIRITDTSYNNFLSNSDYSIFIGWNRSSNTTEIPTITSFTLLLDTIKYYTLPILEFIAIDDDEITGYLITERNTLPSYPTWSSKPPEIYTLEKIPCPILKIPAYSETLTLPIDITYSQYSSTAVQWTLTEDTNTPTTWLKARPTIYTFATAGYKALYLWCKDMNGNISNYSKAETYIKDTAIINPTITDFNIDDITYNGIVNIDTFTATDDISVTGYIVTETPAMPDISNINWSLTPLTNHTIEKNTFYYGDNDFL